MRRRVSSLIAVVCVSVAGLAAAQPADRAPALKTRPSQQDLIRVWPVRALREGLEGEGRIRCIVTVEGALRNCSVVSETPAGSGFGGAALAVTAQIEMVPAIRGGRPVEAPIEIPLRFSCGGACVRNDAILQRVITGSGWTTAPSTAEVLEVYPTGARQRNIGGSATLNCMLRTNGTLRDCSVIREEPPSYDFGRAALRLASKFSGPTNLRRDEEIDGYRAHIVVTFSPTLFQGPAPLVTQPNFRRTPSPQQIGQAFPADAGVPAGQGVIRCVIGDNGAMKDCAVAREEPAGKGFGQAALSLASAFEVGPWTSDGQPAFGRSVELPIRFESRPRQAGAPGPGGPGGGPPWVRTPTQEEIGALLPRAARAAGVGGQAAMRCRVTATGDMEACVVVSEEPAGMGFGAAVLSASNLYKMAPTTPDGRSVGGSSITLSLSWRTR